MSFSRSVGVLISLACLLGMAVAADKPVARASSPASAGSAEHASILPQQFGGWQMQGSAKTSTDPAVADTSNAAVLKEYGFSDLAVATYTRDDGRTLKIRAARFADASGAFGAYTFYLQPQMTPENSKKEDKIGDQAAFLGQRVLFYRGHVLVDAQFSQESAMSGEQLRELAAALPRPSGNAANLPTFIEFMPHRDYVANTQKYAMGPAALAALAPPVSADLVDFNASAEVTLGRYDTASGEATLMLISYPTPKLAADHLKRIAAAHQTAQPQAGSSSAENSASVNPGSENSGSFSAKRTGPIVAIAAGPVSESDAKSLLGMVNYEASVTWNQPTENAQARDLYMLILNVVILCGVLAGLAMVAGVAFGGIRILMKRWYPDKVFDRPEHLEFISLRLTETIVKRTSQGEADGGRPLP
jgi:hypothetical protein